MDEWLARGAARGHLSPLRLLSAERAGPVSDFSRKPAPRPALRSRSGGSSLARSAARARAQRRQLSRRQPRGACARRAPAPPASSCGTPTSRRTRAASSNLPPSIASAASRNLDPPGSPSATISPAASESFRLNAANAVNSRPSLRWGLPADGREPRRAARRLRRLRRYGRAARRRPGQTRNITWSSARSRASATWRRARRQPRPRTPSRTRPSSLCRKWNSSSW